MITITYRVLFITVSCFTTYTRNIDFIINFKICNFPKKLWILMKMLFPIQIAHINATHECEHIWQLGTTHTTTDDNTFCSIAEPRINYFLQPRPSSPPSPPHKMKRKFEMGMSFPNKGGMSEHFCEACGQMIPSKDIPGSSAKN